MELIRGLHNLRPHHHGCVATIGNFDGVHLGHQAVIGQLAEKGEALGLPTTVICFEPQPLEVFRPDEVPPRLTRLREKLQALKRYSVDRVLLIRFNQRFAAMTAEAFIDEVLVRGLGIRYLVVGDDFRFGKGRTGDFAMLQQAGQQHGFQVVSMHTFSVDGERVSSTRVRAALVNGELETAEKLLGRPYRMCGRVAHGDKIGRTIGIPTANIFLHRKRSPLHGIFVVEVFGLDGEPIMGAASIGTRPTIGGTRTLLEIHLLDFDDHIYGKHLQINFLHKIRDEEKYDTMDELKTRINMDIEETRAWFRTGKSASV
ncbi:MAG: bifunctional riboflavin kinase/FAD synthetase [Acidiferrobacterales bacterium]|jgi:riboflavin kinase/FMN adenylyltransferase|nr:bifunctional riboflavin kinase/FAD synthetase [Acidiferrobacterales bacterium]